MIMKSAFDDNVSNFPMVGRAYTTLKKHGMQE